MKLDCAVPNQSQPWELMIQSPQFQSQLAAINSLNSISLTGLWPPSNPTAKQGSRLSSGPVLGLCVVLSLSDRPKEERGYQVVQMLVVLRCVCVMKPVSSPLETEE